MKILAEMDLNSMKLLFGVELVTAALGDDFSMIVPQSNVLNFKLEEGHLEVIKRAMYERLGIPESDFDLIYTDEELRQTVSDKLGITLIIEGGNNNE